MFCYETICYEKKKKKRVVAVRGGSGAAGLDVLYAIVFCIINFTSNICMRFNI